MRPATPTDPVFAAHPGDRPPPVVHRRTLDGREVGAGWSGDLVGSAGRPDEWWVNVNYPMLEEVRKKRGSLRLRICAV